MKAIEIYSDDDLKSLHNATDMFSGIVKKDLKLQTRLGRFPSATDGSIIIMNPDHALVKDAGNLHTLLHHEFAHIYFNSNPSVPVRVFDVLMHEGKYGLGKCGSIYASNCEWFKDLAFAVYNIIEDYRIEWNWSRIYEGDEDRFEELKQRMFDRGHKNQVALDGINTLLLARIGDDSIIELFKSDKDYRRVRNLYDYFKRSLVLLRGKSWQVTYPILKDIIERIINEFGLSGSNPPPKVDRPKGGAGQEGGGESMVSKPSGAQDDKKDLDDYNDSKDKVDAGNKIDALKDLAKDVMDSLVVALGDVLKNDEFLKGETNDVERNAVNSNKRDWDAFNEIVHKKMDEILAGASVDGSQEIKDLKDKVAKAASKRKDFGNYDNDMSEEQLDSLKKQMIIKNLGSVGDDSDDWKTNGAIEIHGSQVINSFLSRIKAKLEMEEEISGDLISMPRAIRHVIYPTGGDKLFDRRESTSGIKITFLLDISTSMASELGTEIRIVGSIFDSVTNNNFVSIEIFAYASGKSIYRVPRERLTSLHASGGTNTATALSLMLDELKRDMSETKLFILITDGRPTDDIIRDGRFYRTCDLLKRMRRMQVSPFVIGIGDLEDEFSKAVEDAGIPYIGIDQTAALDVKLEKIIIPKIVSTIKF